MPVSCARNCRTGSTTTGAVLPTEPRYCYHLLYDCFEARPTNEPSMCLHFATLLSTPLRAKLRGELGNALEAAAAYDRVIVRYRGVYTNYLGRARARALGGDPDGAATDIETARRIAPSAAAPEISHVEDSIPLVMGDAGSTAAPTAAVDGNTSARPARETQQTRASTPNDRSGRATHSSLQMSRQPQRRPTGRRTLLCSQAIPVPPLASFIGQRNLDGTPHTQRSTWQWPSVWTITGLQSSSCCIPSPSRTHQVSSFRLKRSMPSRPPS